MHIHILGICGTFMAGIAAIARSSGHRVTGADTGVYPPMSDQLAALGIEITQGYDQGDGQQGQWPGPVPDLVIVGNVMSRGMPVIETLLTSGIPYCSGPEWLSREVLRDRQVLAVAGTHGKTTTTGLLAWILDCAGHDPGFLIGGVCPDLGVSARLGTGRTFVIEADEYDTAFFDKRAKFLHYHPHTLVINNLEFDHADIYADLDAILWQFHQLIRMIPGDARLIVNAADENIRRLLEMGCWTPFETFSSRNDSSPQWLAHSLQDARLQVQEAGGHSVQSGWQLTGNHNAENALAAVLAARTAGVDIETALQAIARFTGVKRRLELLGMFGGVNLYDDFAHHPTAIRRTLEAMQPARSEGRLLVVLEPASNTMKAGIHRDSLAGALMEADRVWVYRPEGLEWDIDSALADAPGLCIGDSIADIVTAVAEYAARGDSLVVMSNGGFQGIHRDLQQALSQGS